MEGKNSRIKKITRKQTDNYIIGQSTENLPSNVLPTSGTIVRRNFNCNTFVVLPENLRNFAFLGDVLRRIKYIQKVEKRAHITEFVCCSLTTSNSAVCENDLSKSCCLVKEVKVGWIKAGFQTLKDSTIKARLIKLHSEYIKLRKQSPKKVSEFELKCNKLFDIGAVDLKDLIMSDRKRDKSSKTEDLQFLEDQQGERKQKMDKEDQLYASKYKKSAAKTANITKITMIEKKKREQRETLVELNSDSDENDNVEQTVQLSAKKPRNDIVHDTRGFVTISLPIKNISALTADVAKANHISVRGATSIISKLITSGGGDLDQFNLSKSTMHRQMNSAIKKKASTIRDMQKELVKNHNLILHFDRKLVKDYTNGKVSTNERCSILVSSPTLEKDVLIGVPVISSSAGAHQVEGLIPLLDEWGIRAQIFGICCDSTATQTGKYSGAIQLLQKELEQPVVWIICRRHITELHAKHAMQIITGDTTAPYDPLFKKLQDKWNDVAKEVEDMVESNTYTKFDWKKHRGSFLGERAQEVLQFCQRASTVGTFDRGDYKEMCELAALYLGVKVPDFKGILRPGAHHNARFMAKAIYIEKLVMFQKILPFLSDQDLNNINRAAIFVVLFYVPWFLTCALPEKAPSNDLLALQQMRKFATVDSQLANAVNKSLCRHTWFFSQHLCLAAIVDDDLDDIVRAKMAAKLLSHQVPDSFTVGYPEINLPISEIKELSDLIGPDSWFLIKLSKITDMSWLQEKVENWWMNSSYQRFKKFITKLSVVNDCAERGVKLIQEFVDSSQDESLRQDIMTTVKEYRSKINSKNMNKEFCYSLEFKMVSSL